MYCKKAVQTSKMSFQHKQLIILTKQPSQMFGRVPNTFLVLAEILFQKNNQKNRKINFTNLILKILWRCTYIRPLQTKFFKISFDWKTRKRIIYKKSSVREFHGFGNLLLLFYRMKNFGGLFINPKMIFLIKANKVIKE